MRYGLFPCKYYNRIDQFDVYCITYSNLNKNMQPGKKCNIELIFFTNMLLSLSTSTSTSVASWQNSTNLYFQLLTKCNLSLPQLYFSVTHNFHVQEDYLNTKNVFKTLFCHFTKKYEMLQTINLRRNIHYTHIFL